MKIIPMKSASYRILVILAAVGTWGAPLGNSVVAGVEENTRRIASDLPANAVDLRPVFEKYGLEPRVQGKRGTCSVFTIVDAIEFAVARRDQAGTRLSVEFLNWASNDAIGKWQDGGFFSDLWKGFEKHGLCSQKTMPYADEYDRARVPSEAARSQARRLRDAGLELHWIKTWNPHTGLTDGEFQAIQQVLARQVPVCGGLRWPTHARWQDDVLQMAAPQDVYDGHSILLVGYEDSPQWPGGGRFLFRNSSRGVRSGYMTYEYARAYMNDAVWIDFKPVLSPSPSPSPKPVALDRRFERIMFRTVLENYLARALTHASALPATGRPAARWPVGTGSGLAGRAARVSLPAVRPPRWQ